MIESWIADQGERRFFLYLQLVDPHEYLPDPTLLERWGRAEPEEFVPSLWIALERSKQAELDRHRDLIRDHVDYYSSVYDATVAEADEVMGKLVASLRANGVLEDTVIAFTSDHGEEFYEHGQVMNAKQVYDESVHVPLILAGPGVPVGERRDARVENRHLAPTLLARAGVEARDNLAGDDLLDAADLRDAADRPVFCSTQLGRWTGPDGVAVRSLASIHAVRHNGLLYVWNPEPPDGDSGERLFDTEADPAALTDLAADRPDDCERLRALIVDWFERGEARRPSGVSGGETSIELLRRLGYIGD